MYGELVSKMQNDSRMVEKEKFSMYKDLSEQIMELKSSNRNYEFQLEILKRNLEEQRVLKIENEDLIKKLTQ